jgi:hypothetical protein
MASFFRSTILHVPDPISLHSRRVRISVAIQLRSEVGSEREPPTLTFSNP